MAIITISRGLYSRGSVIAEKVAKKLGYECVSREVLLEASEHFNTPEIKLARALRDAPSVWERFTHAKQRYLAYIAQAFLEHVQKDNVVYHGQAGHFFLKGVAHTLKVRVIASLNDRVRIVMEREKIPEPEARHLLEQIDAARHKWGLALYGIDSTEASLYDMVLRVCTLSQDDVVDLICRTAELPHFQTTPESQQVLDDLVLAAKVKNSIICMWPNADVSVDRGNVAVYIEAPLMTRNAVSEQILALVRQVPGIEDAQVHVRPATFLSTY